MSHSAIGLPAFEGNSGKNQRQRERMFERGVNVQELAVQSAAQEAQEAQEAQAQADTEKPPENRAENAPPSPAPLPSRSSPSGFRPSAGSGHWPPRKPPPPTLGMRSSCIASCVSFRFKMC